MCVCFYQTLHDGRQFMKYIDPKLGVALPERAYGGNCLLYDPGNTTDPFHNVWVGAVTSLFSTHADQLVRLAPDRHPRNGS